MRSRTLSQISSAAERARLPARSRRVLIPEQHDGRGAEQQDLADCVRARQPARARGSGCTTATWPPGAGRLRTVGDARVAVGQASPHDAGPVGEDRQRLRFAEQIVERRVAGARLAAGWLASDAPWRSVSTMTRLAAQGMPGMTAVERGTRASRPRASRRIGVADRASGREMEARMSMSPMASISVSSRPDRRPAGMRIEPSAARKTTSRAGTRRRSQGSALIERRVGRIRERSRYA